MKAMNFKSFCKLFAIPLLMALAFSCTKDPFMDSTPITNLENVQIDESFEWRTTSEVEFNLVFPQNLAHVVIYISSTDEKSIFSKGMSVENMYSRTVTIPTYIETVKISFGNNVLPSQEVDVRSGRVDFYFNENFKSATQVNDLPWNYTITGVNHTILIPSTVTFSNLLVSTGDYIGVFYDSLGSMVCAGYTEYDPSGNMFISAWGVDNGNDGFASGENFNYKIWKSTANVSYDATASYNSGFPNQNQFVANGMSAITSFTVNVVADADSDGVGDSDDDYPNDATRAFDNYYPASGYGSYAFEDLWPGSGDYDFNDLVVDFKANTVENANGVVVEIIYQAIVVANGASFHNAFGLMYDNVLPSWISAVSGTDLQEGIINTDSKGLEQNQSKATIVFFDDAFNRLPYANDGSMGVNTNNSGVYVEPDTQTVVITFNTSFGKTSNDIYSNGRENPFVIINQNRGREVHLANRIPTDLADSNYFGTSDDNSNPGNSSYYKSTDNLPWGIEVGSEFDHPTEKDEINLAYLKFIPWIQSSGTSYADWYKNLAGYRNPSYIFNPANAN